MSPFDWTGFAFPKGKPRVEEKAESAKNDRREEARWKRQIWTRDQGLDRKTGRKVKRTLALHPERGECHHVASRDDRAVRWDRRNGILLSYTTHRLVETNVLRIVGTKFFTVNGKQYIDCDHPVKFQKV